METTTVGEGLFINVFIIGNKINMYRYNNKRFTNDKAERYFVGRWLPKKIKQ